MSDKRLPQLENLANVPNDAMLYVVYNGESYHTTKAQLLASIENRIIAIGTISHTDLTTVFGANFQWIVNGVSNTNTSSITKVLTAASTGFQKVAIGVLNASNGIDVVYGDEVAIGETMVQPPTPVNTLFLTRWDIIEDVATVPTEPIVGDDFVEKAEFIQKSITGTGEIAVVLDSQETNFVLASDGITMVEGTAPTSGYLANYLRDDKILSFYNATSNPIVFKHSVEEHNFRMPDAENLTVEPNELVRFRQFKDDVLCYQYDSLSRVGGGTTQNLQEVTDVGATTTNDVKFQLSENTFIIIKSTTQEIEFYENVSGSPVLRSKMDKGSFNVYRNGGGSALMDGNSVYIEDATAEYSIGLSLDPLTGLSSLNFTNNLGSTVYFIDKINVFGTEYSLPDGVSSQIATNKDIDDKVAGLLDLRGVWDASSNAFPTTGGSGTSGAILKGDFWYVSVAGILNGVSVNIGDSFFAKIDSPTSSDWQILESNLGYVPENLANKNNTTLNNSSTEYPTSGLVLKELQPIVVSSNVTAILNRVHNVVANATFTDPTPVEGKGYHVNVINGVATVGGVAYSVGTQLFRHYVSGSWRTFVYPSTLQLENFLRDETLLKGYVCVTPNGINAPNGFRDITYSGNASTGYILQNNYAKTGEIGMVGFQSTTTAGTVAFKRRNDFYNFSNTNAIIWQKIEFDSNVSGARFHHLLSNNFLFTAPTNVNQTSLLNCVGFCKLATSDNLHILHNDNTGTATSIDLGSSFPASNSVGNKRYLLGIQIKATSYVLTVIEINTTTNALTTNIYTTEVSTDIPARSSGSLQISTMITNNATASNATYLDGGLVATNLF